MSPNPMTQADPPVERELLQAVERFLSCVVTEAPFAEQGVRAAHEGLVALVTDGGSPEAKDQWVRSLLGMYGGMGSVNDFPWSPEGEAAKEDLYRRLLAARGLYHGLMGGERHDPASFPVLGKGARVRLVQGSTYHVDTSGTRFIVEGRDFPVDAVWVVRAAYDPDVTGTPTYGLSFEDRYIKARASAVEPLRDT